jgi:hypothetical protein
MKTRRGKVARNIIKNTPASGWHLATLSEKLRLRVPIKVPRYVRNDTIVRKGSVSLSRDEFTVKKFGLNRRQLVKVRAEKGGTSHPVYGYQTPGLRHLGLIREARREYEAYGDALQVALNATRAKHHEEMVQRVHKRGRNVKEGVLAPWLRFGEFLDKAIGPDTGTPVVSRELTGTGWLTGADGKRTRIEDGEWHALIDALKAEEGEGSTLVKLLRSSGRYAVDGVWVVD